MADIFNEQRVVGVVFVPDGTTMYNGRPVVGVVSVADGVYFVDNQRVVKGVVISDGSVIYNDQPVLGVVDIQNGRKLYNNQLVIPLTGAGLVGDAYIDFSKMANGAPGPAATGQTTQRETTAYSTVVVASVSSGALVAGASGQASTAAYTGLSFAEEVKSIYADVSFGDAIDEAALIATGGVTLVADTASSLHISFKAGSFIVGYASNGVLTTPLGSIAHSSMPFGTKVRIGWRISGNDLYVLQANGVEVGPYNLPAVVTRTNYSVIFEHYRNATGAPGTKFYAVAVNLFSSPAAAGRTNLYSAQNNILNAAWTKAGFGSYSGAQLDASGGALGERILEDASTGNHWFYQSLAGAASTRYTLRFKVKPVGRDWVQLICYDGVFTGFISQYFNLTTNAIGSLSGNLFTDPVASIYPLANGFFQVLIGFRSGANAGVVPALGTASADATNAFAGDVSKGLIVYDQWLFARPT